MKKKKTDSLHAQIDPMAAMILEFDSKILGERIVDGVMTPISRGHALLLQHYQLAVNGNYPAMRDYEKLVAAAKSHEATIKPSYWLAPSLTKTPGLINLSCANAEESRYQMSFRTRATSRSMVMGRWRSTDRSIETAGRHKL